MNEMTEKEVEFRIVIDDELPPIVIKSNEDNNEPVIIINLHHKIWLSLQRSTIPGICKSMASKLNELCDSYLTDQLRYEGME